MILGVNLVLVVRSVFTGTEDFDLEIAASGEDFLVDTFSAFPEDTGADTGTFFASGEAVFGAAVTVGFEVEDLTLDSDFFILILPV